MIFSKEKMLSMIAINTLTMLKKNTKNLLKLCYQIMQQYHKRCLIKQKSNVTFLNVVDLSMACSISEELQPSTSAQLTNYNSKIKCYLKLVKCCLEQIKQIKCYLKQVKRVEMLFRIKIEKKVLIYQHFLTNKCFKLLYSLFQQSP